MQIPTKDTLVRVLTPILTPLGGAIAAEIAKNVPGVRLPVAAVVSLTVLGAAAVLLTALHWLQKNAKVVNVADTIDQIGDKVVAKIQADPIARPATAAIIAELRAQEPRIVAEVSKAASAPAWVAEMLQAIGNQVAVRPAPVAVVASPPPADATTSPATGGSTTVEASPVFPPPGDRA